MTFLNATLVFGIAAVAVPIVLHLISRREPRKVVFPSVRFLTKRFESNRSRMRVRRWWLLALRIAALAFLALALARPAIHHSLSITWLTIGLVAALGLALLILASVALARGQSRPTAYGLGGGAAATLLIALIWATVTYASGPAPQSGNSEPVAMAIVLDNSPTSAWATADDTRAQRMKDLATWMVTRLPRTSRIAIIDRSAQVAGFSLDVASAIAKIEQLPVLEETQPISARIDAAARLVRTSDLTNRQILLITDLAESTWNESLAEADLATVLGEDPAVALTVFDLGPFNAPNRTLSVPRFADATPPKGVPIAVSATLSLEAAADSPAVSATAELELYDNDPSLPVVRDGEVKRPTLRSVDRTSVRVAPGGSSELLLTIPSLGQGTHHGRIRLVGTDAMPLDDTRYFTLEVLPPSRILLVSDDVDEARVINQTIIAAPGLIDEENAEFVVERIAFTDLAVVRLSDFDAVILLDPPRDVFSDDQVVQLARDGGGVLVCLGPAAGEQRIDATWTPRLVRRWRPTMPGSFFRVTAPTHPVTQTVATETPWADFRVRQYWQIETEPSDKVLIKYAGTDHPALIERIVKRSGQGRSGSILVLSTPLPALAKATRAWNDLFSTDPWPAWLLTRQMVEYLTGRAAAELMTPVGRPQAIQLPRPEEDSTRPQRIQLFPPGDVSPIPLSIPQDASQVTVTDIPKAGIYWLRGLTPGAGFSANLPQRSTSLERIDPAQLDLFLGPDRYTLATDRAGIEFAESKASQRVSLHSPAILLVLVVFLLEQILGNRFYRGRG